MFLEASLQASPRSEAGEVIPKHSLEWALHAHGEVIQFWLLRNSPPEAGSVAQNNHVHTMLPGAWVRSSNRAGQGHCVSTLGYLGPWLVAFTVGTTGTEGPALQGVLGQCWCQVWPAVDKAPLRGPSPWLLRTGDSSYVRNPCSMGGRGLKPTSCRQTSREVWKASHVKSGQAPIS